MLQKIEKINKIIVIGDFNKSKSELIRSLELIDFAKFVDQHDERYGSKFTEVFPEYEGFYHFAKESRFE